MMDPAELPARAVPEPIAAIIAADELRILQEIEPRYRKVLVAFAHGHKMPAIAAELRIPLSTGYTYLRLAREGIAAALRRRAARERR